MSKELIDRLKSYIPSGDGHNSQYANDLADAVAILESKAAPVGEREAFEVAYAEIRGCLTADVVHQLRRGDDYAETTNERLNIAWRAFQAGAAYQRQSGVVMPSAEKLADLFIGCPLPRTVRVDPCALDPDYPHRFGTNLLTWGEARLMFGEMLAHLKDKEVFDGH